MRKNGDQNQEPSLLELRIVLAYSALTAQLVSDLPAMGDPGFRFWVGEVLLEKG